MSEQKIDIVDILDLYIDESGALECLWDTFKVSKDAENFKVEFDGDYLITPDGKKYKLGIIEVE